MMSKKSKYALRALLALARRRPDEPVLISELADQEAIPKKFLELILLELKNNGILQSRKGRGGGYFLAKRPEQISLGEVIRALDGPLAPVACVSQRSYHTCDECDDEATCGIRAVMKNVRDATAGILDRETLAGVQRRTDELRQEKKKALVYAI
jgi:Rrf2 family protein